MLTARLLVKSADHVISEMQRDRWVVILGKSTTTGITEAIWTSTANRKDLRGEMMAVFCCIIKAKRAY